MKQEDLFQAIGGLDERYLEESEAGAAARPRRVLWKAVAIAAILSTMVMTAAAAANWFIGLEGSEPEVTWQEFEFECYKVDENGVGTGEILDCGPAYRMDISMELDINPDAPNTLETTYMLQVPEHWDVENKAGSYRDDQVWHFFVIWDPSGDSDGVISDFQESNGESYTEDLVRFEQRSAYTYHLWDDHRVDSLPGIPERVNVTSELVTLAGISMLKVHIPAFTRTTEEWAATSLYENFMREGEIRLYWTDGNSILSLHYPTWMTDEEIGSILETIFVVEDIEEYLDLQPPVPPVTED